MLRDFRSVGATDDGIRDLAEGASAFMPTPGCGGDESTAGEVRDAHLPKTGQGGAASFVMPQRWASPRGVGMGSLPALPRLRPDASVPARASWTAGA
jgi:hypothetical protein